MSITPGLGIGDDGSAVLPNRSVPMLAENVCSDLVAKPLLERCPYIIEDAT